MKAHASAPFGKQSDARDENTSSFLTVNETAVLLRVSVRTLQKLMGRGLPCYAPVPHRRLFLQTEVEAWLRNNSRPEGEATLNTKPANTPPSRGQKSDPLSGEPVSPLPADQPPDEPSHQEPECHLVQSTFVAEMPTTENKNNQKPAAKRRTVNKTMKDTSTIEHTMDDRQKLETLANQIAQQGGYYEGLTEAKIYERGVVVNDPTRPAWIVVDVTRHKAVLGTIYRRGAPMSAFVEYRQRVALNPETNELQIDPQGIADDGARLVINYDSFGDDSVDHNGFDFESSGDGSVMCRERLSHETCVVASQDDVEEFAREICDNWYLGHFQEEVSEYFSPNETKEHMRRIVSAMETALVAKAVSAWRNFNSEVRTSAKSPTPPPARSLTRPSAARLRPSRKRCP